MNDEETVESILERYVNKCIGDAIADGAECASKQILAMIKVADFHAELANKDFAGVGKHPNGVMRVMSRGMSTLLPKLIAANGPNSSIELPATDDEFQAVRRSLMQTGELLKFQEFAKAEKYDLFKCQVLAPDEIEIRRMAPDEEASEHNDRNALLDAQHAERLDERHRLDLLFQQAAESRRDTGPSGYWQAFDAFREVGRQYLELFVSEYAEADAFANGTKIGPFTFAQWKQIVSNICSLGFAKACLEDIFLIEQGRFDPQGFLTLMPTRISDAELRQCFLVPGVPEQPGLFEQVKSCVILSDENAKLDYGPDGVAPCLVSIGGAVFAPRYSRLGNPYQFLVQRLAIVYSFQMRRILAEREKQFQDELAALLNTDLYLFGDANVKLFKGKQEITDIDAVVYEKSTGCLYLVQLKWLAVHANELDRREEQYDHLRGKAGGWVQKVGEWVDRVGHDKVLQTVGLGGQAIDPAKLDIRLFVLNRWWARFSGKEPFDARAAWLSWSRLRWMMREVPSGSPPLDHAYGKAMGMVPPPFTAAAKPETYVVAGLTVNLYA
jgi:hypothetical protein